MLKDINDRRGSDRPHRPRAEDTCMNASEGLFDDEVQLLARGPKARANHRCMRLGEYTLLTMHVYNLAVDILSKFIGRLKDRRVECHDQHRSCFRIPPMSEARTHCSDYIRTDIRSPLAAKVRDEG
jgi:hypothetical protein